jgi:1-acyl-sn-glycerol-3-phosphate acyltransferase
MSAVEEVWADSKTGERLKQSSWSSRLLQSTSVSLGEFFRLHRSQFMRKIVMGVKKLIYFLFRAFYGLRVEGLSHIPESGPFLICPNHLSSLDPLILYALLPDDTLYLAHGGYFQKPLFSWIIRFSRLLITGGGGRVPECLQLAYQGLEKGMLVCLFPEGRRSETGHLLKPRLGAGILACEAATPILPVCIEGTSATLSPRHPGFRFCRLMVKVGLPIYPQLHSKDSEMNYAEILQRWSNAIRKMQNEGRC